MKRLALTMALLSGLVLASAAVSTAVNAAPSRSRDLRHADEVRGANGEIMRDGKAITPEESKALALAEAPAVLQRANTTCTITDALATGNGKVTIDGAQVDVKTYEVACGEGLGYLLQDRGAGGAFAFDCIQIAASNAAAAAAAPAAEQRRDAPPAAAPQACRLPGNQNATAMIQPLVTGAGARCTVNNVSFLGVSPSNDLHRYEVGCTEGMGYLIDRLPGQPVKAADCLAADAGGYDCKFTPKANRTAYISAIAARSNRPCTVSDGRYMGATSGGSAFYEVACGGTNGYVLETKGGAFVRALDCLEAAGIGDGCKLTNVAAVAQQREGVYLQALRGKGIACNGTEFRVLGHDSRGRDVVEFNCSDRPAGLVAFLPAAGAPATGDITNFDCFEAEGRNLKCELTSHQSLASRLTSSMAGRCNVSNFQVLGPSATTDGLVVEVACGAGNEGYVVDLPENRSAVTTALTCAHAATRSTDKCSLPENK
jgi:hypothetical protein